MRSAILTYHSLDETGSVISVRPEMFRLQMEALRASGVPVVSLAEVAKRDGAVAITFDDGFANFAEHAAPVLERLGLPATVFVVSGYCGKRNDWPGQWPGIPQLELMSWRMLRELPRNIMLGAHSKSHADLRTLAEDALRAEVIGSREEIEQQASRAVETFAYPYGAVDERVASVVRGAFRAGCGTRLRFVNESADRAVLPRLDAYYLQSARWFRKPLGMANRLYVGARASLREVRGALN